MAEPSSDYDVGVTFYGPEWALTVHWTTGPTTPKEVCAAAASGWFADMYGFDPAKASDRVEVSRQPD